MASSGFTVQDGAAAAVTATGTVKVTPGNTITVALSSTSGVITWRTKCTYSDSPLMFTPAPPGGVSSGISNYQTTSGGGSISSWSFTAPSTPCSIILVSAADDGSGTVATATATLAVDLVGGANEAVAPFSQVIPVRGAVSVNETLASFDSVSAGTIRDGVTYTQGQTVLLVNQTTPSQNGPYIVGVVSSGAAPLTRPPWFATGSVQSANMMFKASEGTAGKNAMWEVQTTGAWTVDTTSVTLVERNSNWVECNNVTSIVIPNNPASYFFIAGLLQAKFSGIFQVDIDLGLADNTTADSVTIAVLSDTSASGVLGTSGTKAAVGVSGLGAFGAAGIPDLEVMTAGATGLTYNGAAFSTAPITQRTETFPTLSGLLSGSAQKYQFHELCYNAIGATKTAFTVGNTVAFGVKVSATNTITIAQAAMRIAELAVG